MVNPQMPVVAIFDKSRLLDVADSGEDFVAEMVSEFRLMMVEKLEKLVRSLLEGDFQRIRAEAHSIKGASAVMGADRIMAVSIGLEEAAVAENAPEIELRMGELRQEYSDFLRVASRE